MLMMTNVKRNTNKNEESNNLTYLKSEHLYKCSFVCDLSAFITEI